GYPARIEGAPSGPGLPAQAVPGERPGDPGSAPAHRTTRDWAGCRTTPAPTARRVRPGGWHTGTFHPGRLYAFAQEWPPPFGSTPALGNMDGCRDRRAGSPHLRSRSQGEESTLRQPISRTQLIERLRPVDEVQRAVVDVGEGRHLHVRDLVVVLAEPEAVPGQPLLDSPHLLLAAMEVGVHAGGEDHHPVSPVDPRQCLPRTLHRLVVDGAVVPALAVPMDHPVEIHRDAVASLPGHRRRSLGLGHAPAMRAYRVGSR